MAYTVDEAVEAAKELGLPVVVKAQIHAGGRGKGGGVKLARTAEDVEQIAKAMLGMTLKTHQTGPEGRVVRRLLIEQGVDLEGAKEMYLAIVVDRATGAPGVHGLRAGRHGHRGGGGEGPEGDPQGADRPRAWASSPSRPASSPSASACPRRTLAKAVAFMQALYQRVRGHGRVAARDQPVPDHEGRDVLALDAKVNFDDNALYRHPELKELRDLDEEDPLEVEASKFGLNYIKLEGGNVGCMVNGAGLAMATMDIIKLAGGAPPTSSTWAAAPTRSRSATRSAS